MGTLVKEDSWDNNSSYLYNIDYLLVLLDKESLY